MFIQVADWFSNARVRRRERAYPLRLPPQAERKDSWRLAGLADVLGEMQAEKNADLADPQMSGPRGRAHPD
jgi:hypothetical protein